MRVMTRRATRLLVEMFLVKGEALVGENAAAIVTIVAQGVSNGTLHRAIGVLKFVVADQQGGVS